MAQKTRVLIAEDQGILRWCLAKVLNEYEELLVVGEAQDGNDLVEKYFLLKPDISLVDISMPKLDGFSALQKIREKDGSVKFLFISGHSENIYISKVIDQGGYGLLDKSVNEMELYHAICEVMKGESYFMRNYPDLKANIPSRPETDNDHLNSLEKLGLTESEKKILRLYGQGYGTNDIAESLFKSKKTIDFHRANLMSKMKINSFAKFIALASKLTE